MENKVVPQMGMMEIDIDVAVDEYIMLRREIVMAFEMALVSMKRLSRGLKHVRV